jgi:hypothetical protein
VTNVRKLCIVTIHGIGFQQPPTATTPGYADGLHQALVTALDGKLGSDPLRDGTPDGAAAPYGPVYVASANPGTRDTEWGLSRLGTWRSGGAGAGGLDIDISNAPLTAGDETVAHVALVYTSMENSGPPLDTETGALAEAALHLGNYTSVAGALKLVLGDAWAALHAGKAAPSAAAPDLRPRTDLADLALTGAAPDAAALDGADRHASAAPSGFGAVARTMEDDFVAYVCRNDLRERLREFVTEVLRRLQARPDVSGVVINAHSQGTVVTFDTLRPYPNAAPASTAPASTDSAHPDAAPEPFVRALSTAGSPLRKYADLFSWGNEVGGIAPVRKWVNFWDEKDPVADPLDPPSPWRRGSPPEREPGSLGLFWAADSDGTRHPVPVEDHLVNNLKHANDASIRAHNYWGNVTEFVPGFAALVESALK